jgi:microcystin-dependent protein
MRVASEQKEAKSGRRSFLTKAVALLAGTTLFGGLFRSSAVAATNGASPANGGLKQVDFANPAIGQILMFAGNYAPTGWAFCDGSLMSIPQYSALFSVLGTTYGGDGISNFALPDLRGRVPLGFGAAAGMPAYNLGQSGGETAHKLTVSEMPAHSHAANADTSNGTSDSPVGNVPAVNSEGIMHYGSTVNGQMNTAAIGSTGGGQPHNIMQPYLAINFIISLQGVFPARS